jgi:hypothetical protein
MSDSYTFEAVGISKENPGEKVYYTLSVKKEFLEKCPNPEAFEPHELNVKHYMFKFLHNDSGPAIVRKAYSLSPERIEYWLDGRCISTEDKEKAAKMAHNNEFNKKLDSVLED